MFFTRSLSALASIASIASSMPTELVERALTCTGNGTVYASTSAGEVCVYRPSDCTNTYLVQPGDSCYAIASKYNSFTESILYYWNPDIGQTCLGLRAYVPVCISTPWYTYSGAIQQPDGTVVNTDSVAPTEVPVPVMPSIVAQCDKYYLVGGGDRVDTIVSKNAITQDDFLSWNPAIDKDTPVAWSGYWVCVGVSATASI